MADTSASSGQQQQLRLPKNNAEDVAEAEIDTETSIIDLVESSDDDDDENDDVVFVVEATKKKSPTVNGSMNLPSNADVVDLVNDNNYNNSPTISSKTRIASECNENMAKNSRKRPRTSIETINLLDSGDDEATETEQVTTDFERTTTTAISHSNSNANGTHRHSGTEIRTAQHLVIEPGDSAILTRGIAETMHALSVSSGNRCWTCLGSDSNAATTTPAFVAAHIQQTDSWSCGYRNFQMMLSALLPRLRESPQHSVFQKIPRRLPPTPISIPSLARIQTSMEDGWNEGFDPTGADHYRGSISGKSGNGAKIGAMEVANLCWYHGIDAVVLQFMKCSESRDLLPYFVAAYFSRAGRSNFDTKTDAILLARNVLSEAAQLFSSRSLPSIAGSRSGGKTIGSVLPLYLQWEGHSVTIVGIEASANQRASALLTQRSFEFLVLDPNKSASSSVKLPWKEIAGKDLQIVLCTERSMPYAERQSCKSRLPAGRVVTAAEDAVRNYLQSSQRR